MSRPRSPRLRASTSRRPGETGVTRDVRVTMPRADAARLAQQAAATVPLPGTPLAQLVEELAMELLPPKERKQ